MARKAVRTDYIYNVTSCDGWTHTRPAHRTLAGATRVAGEGMTRPKRVKVAPHRWLVTSDLGASVAQSTIERAPLVN